MRRIAEWVRANANKRGVCDMAVERAATVSMGYSIHCLKGKALPLIRKAEYRNHVVLTAKDLNKLIYALRDLDRQVQKLRKKAV